MSHRAVTRTCGTHWAPGTLQRDSLISLQAVPEDCKFLSLNYALGSAHLRSKCNIHVGEYSDGNDLCQPLWQGAMKGAAHTWALRAQCTAWPPAGAETRANLTARRDTSKHHPGLAHHFNPLQPGQACMHSADMESGAVLI